jgi:hypothetical protein
MLSVNCKHVQHVKIYLAYNFKVNMITHLEVIALFSSNFKNVITRKVMAIPHLALLLGQVS